MTARINHVGQRFGRLTPLESFNVRNSTGDLRVRWNCLCDCGNVKEVSASDLRSGRTKSCGCLARELIQSNTYRQTHGATKGHVLPRLYRIWTGMRNRCRNRSNADFPNYGGRGIVISSEWDDFANFESWSLANGYSDLLSLDRTDNNSGYNPDNCRWVTPADQMSNRRRFATINKFSDDELLTEIRRRGLNCE